VVDERVSSNDDTDWVYRNVMKYIDEHGAPAGLYNLAAGNLGVGRALTDAGLAGKVLFIGHELNPNSRMLLETGVMNFAIGHDVQIEVAEAISFLTAHLEKKSPAVPPLSQVRIYTK
jgi:LacI family transcriptional regulator